MGLAHNPEGACTEGAGLGIAKWSLDFVQWGNCAVGRTLYAEVCPNDLDRTVQWAVGLRPMGGGQGWVQSTQGNCTVRRSLYQTIGPAQRRAHKMGPGELYRWRWLLDGWPEANWHNFAHGAQKGPGVRGLWVHEVDPTGIQNLNAPAERSQWAQATV